jgi:pyruvate formate lyase activating enzyme
MKEALLYEKSGDRSVRCFLCGHQCPIAEGGFGICGVRQNQKGVLYTFAYGALIASHVDPIEKKPLYHFLPGSTSFSIAAPGCNFRCGFCQNWQISQVNQRDGSAVDAPVTSPEVVVKTALQYHCQSISYTYTEPTIFFEYAYDCARLAHEQGLKNVFVTNGFMGKEALEMIRPYLDAANVDLKYFKDASYKKVCGGRLQPVLDTIKLMHQLGVWVEVTTLVVPGSNDSDAELQGIAEFIASVDTDIPWHISRFFPQYKMDGLAPTPELSMHRAVDLGRQAGLRYIYAGNVSGWGSDTFCPHCRKLLLKREGFSILDSHIDKGRCASCKAQIPGIFQRGASEP